MSSERTMRRMSEETGNRRGPERRSERRVSSQIQREVMQLILDRRLQAGAPLPTETELMQDLGVSRNSVREALKALQALDIVDIRHGYGTYVGEASLTPFVDGLTFRTLAQPDDKNETGALAEILQVREVLEEGLIRRVAAVLTEPELDRLEAVVAEMEEAGRSGRPFPELDREFHELLYASLGNALVPQLLGAFWTVFSRVSRHTRLDRRPVPRNDRPPPPRHRHRPARPRRGGRPTRDGRPLPRHRGEGGPGVQGSGLSTGS